MESTLESKANLTEFPSIATAAELSQIGAKGDELSMAYQDEIITVYWIRKIDGNGDFTPFYTFSGRIPNSSSLIAQ